MTSQDERIKAAKRLREYSCDSLKGGSLLKTLKDVTGAGSWRYVLDALADAIDPTCHMVVDGSVWSDELGELTDYACDRCGKVAYGQQERPGFCPNCGARVVSGDD